MKHAKRRIGLYLGCTALGLLSLAVWGKMRFVTNLPRMAYADPENLSDSSAEPSTPENASEASDTDTPETGGDE